MAFEIRHTLSFWIDRGMNPADSDYSSRSILSGYDSLHEVVYDLSRRVTVHSVSFSSIVLPVSSGLIRIFATVIYTGPTALLLYGKKNPHGPGEISNETMLIELWQKGSLNV